MKVLIVAEQIAGIASEGTTLADLPAGFILLDAPDTSLDNLYYAEGEVRVKPDRPSDTAYWDLGTLEWRESATPTVPTPPDWASLVEALRGSEVWAKCYQAAVAKNRTSVALSLLLLALTVTRSLADLNFALDELLASSPAVFSPGDLEYIRTTMESFGFDPEDVPALTPA